MEHLCKVFRVLTDNGSNIVKALNILSNGEDSQLEREEEMEVQSNEDDNISDDTDQTLEEAELVETFARHHRV